MAETIEWAQSKFAERFEQMLKRCKITQKDFAKKNGLKSTTLAGYKTYSEPDFTTLLRIAGGGDVRPEWLAFGSEFEPMDDEELELIEDWRKMADAERHAFSAMCRAVIQDRTAQLKPIGKRSKRLAADAKSGLTPEQVSEIQEVRRDALELMSMVQPGTDAWKIADRAAKRLGRLCAAQPSPEHAAVPASSQSPDEVHA